MLKGFAISPSDMAQRAGEAAALMRALSNEHRLLVLCHLVSGGELSVGQLVERIGLNQSALSQHLAKLRRERLVDFRREAQTLFYHVADARAGQVLELLHSIYCRELDPAAASGNSRMFGGPDAAPKRNKGN